MKFGTIVADPPWCYETWTEAGNQRTPQGMGHYGVMSMEDIAGLSVETVARDDSVLLLWATWCHLPYALTVIERWGFQYRTTVPWVKVSRDGFLQKGMGRHVRHCSEPLLIARRGIGRVAPLTTDLDGILLGAKGAHSAKPDQQYTLAEQYPGPYLEIFARPNGGLMPIRDGAWRHIGNEITGRDIRDDLKLLAEMAEPQTVWKRHEAEVETEERQAVLTI